ncbi:FAD-binding oxidoreductase [uncultured Tateyamaria sp.]|uniref:NAD(P)/FAD-dependent oxidoreductase n=1 Tax=uncultured Tateyamaria sp. TaxID=455651 RepID=UPI0026030231|nr:FAD-binding oxidoreductase [uncultured Tateyamaria sp.]
MTRIFSDYAYGDGPRSGCWWDNTVEIAQNPVLQGDISCDVVIIGAGFTGLSAAYHLARAGASVVVVDANSVGWGASGRNGGFCCLGGGKASDAALDRRVGRDARLEWRAAEKAAVELVESLVSELDLDVDRHSAGETCLAHRPRDARGFAAEAESIVENYGVAPEVLTRAQLSSAGMSGPFHGAMTVPVGFGLNPRKLLAGLYAAARSGGARFFDQSSVTELDKRGVSTAMGRVAAERVILATNGYSSEDVPSWMAGRYMPAQSTVIVTRPLSDKEMSAQGWTSDQMAYDSRHLLHYFRLMPDRRFLFGMRGGVLSSARAEARSRARVTKDFRKMFPAWAQVDIPYSWSGMVCLARGMAPFAGPIADAPGVLAGFAYHGNGVAMGTYTGKLLATLALGDTPDLYPRVMQDPACPFPFGALRRAIMPPLYAAYQIDDLRP